MDIILILITIVVAISFWILATRNHHSSIPFVPESKRVLVGMKPWKDTSENIIVYRVESEPVTYLLYRGNCTVWHVYPNGLRCGTSMESRLCDEWNYAKNYRELGDFRFIGNWTNEEMSIFLGKEVK